MAERIHHIHYAEDEILETAIWLFNTFDVPEGIEAADLKFDLFMAEGITFPWCPGYIFTMDEEE